MLKNSVQNGIALAGYEVFKPAYLFVIGIHLLETKNWLQISDMELGFELIWLAQAIEILNKGTCLSLELCDPALSFLPTENPVWNHKYSEAGRSTIHRKFAADEK